MLPAWSPVGLEGLSLANNVFSELPEGLTACSRWGASAVLLLPCSSALMGSTLLAWLAGILCSWLAGTLRMPPCCSVRELSLARNSQLRLTPQAAEQLAALPQLQCLRISVNRGAPAELGGEAEEAHLAGLRRLLQLLRGRLVLE